GVGDDDAGADLSGVMILFFAERDADAASGLAGVEGIGEKIREDLAEFGAGAEDLDVAVEVGFKGDSLEGGTCEIERDSVIDEAGDAEYDEGSVFAVEGEGLARDVSDARDFELRGFDVFQNLLIG